MSLSIRLIYVVTVVVVMIVIVIIFIDIIVIVIIVIVIVIAIMPCSPRLRTLMPFMAYLLVGDLLAKDAANGTFCVPATPATSSALLSLGP